MDQATLQAKVAKGYGKAAIRLGATTAQYRPSSLTSPLADVHGTFLAAFNNDAGFSFKQPTPWGKPMVFGLFDTTDVQAGDLLACGADTYFVARFEPFQPPLCVQCNNAVTLSPGNSGASGADSSGACSIAGLEPGYSGLSSLSSDLTGAWPCYLGIKNSGRGTDSGLPGSERAAEFDLFLPLMPGFVPAPYMTFTDDDGIGYTIGAVESSPYGFRCIASVQQL